ncbi:MAG TPA: helix-turn-helix transcriptional regulator [Chloroflexia bacterium]
MGINGKRIRERRKELGWTLAELARQVGINPAHLWRIETGAKGGGNPSAKTLRRFAEVLGLSESELLTPVEPDVDENAPQELALAG